MTNTSVPVLLGAATNIPAARMLGSIDQVRFFNTALTDAQAEDCYTDETTTTAATLDFPVGAGCIAAYQLDGDASDISGTYGGVETDIGYTGLEFQPDFVWVKRRDNGVGNTNNLLFDSVRGAGERLMSNTTNDESLETDEVTSFNSNGFTVGADVSTNGSGGDLISWNWYGGGAPTAPNTNGAGLQPTAGSVMIDGVSSTAALAGTIAATNISANTAAGFSIVEYEGSGATATVGHGLGSIVELLIVKGLETTNDWSVLSKDNANGNFLQLNGSSGQSGSGSIFGSPTARPTDSVFTIGNTGETGTNGKDYVAYCFHSVANYQKLGSYTGTGASSNIISTEITSGDGGFEPAFLMIKRTDANGGWIMLDNKRSTSNPRTKYLTANTSDAEGDAASIDVNFLTNGFSVGGTNGDINVGTYIYLAIAADEDTSVPTLANSFEAITYTGNGGTQNISTSFAPDFVWVKDRDNNATSHTLADSVRGVNNTINSNTTGGQYNNTTYQYNSFNSNGFTVTDDNGGNYGVNGDGIDYISWNWKAGGLPSINTDGSITSIVSANQAAGFSVVKYNNPATIASHTIGHGLGTGNAPKLIILKTLGSSINWFVYSPAGTGVELNLNTPISVATDANRWANTAPTDLVFTIGTSFQYSVYGGDTIAYCFADIAGYQRVSSYQGSGVAGKRVYVTNDGLATGSGGFQPSYVLIKCSTASGTDWLIFTSNVVDGSGDPVMLRANTSESQFTGDRVQFTSDGFTIEDADGSRNGSARTYIYLAIA